MYRTRAGTLVVGSLPEGCNLCLKGAKLVLFVTGLCARRCFYCPLSRSKKDRDLIYANERPVTKDEDLLSEAEAMDAKGAGFTGGDPMLKPERTLHFLKLLKQHYGEGFHVHLYTTPQRHLSVEALRLLSKAGLDELRLHPDLKDIEGCARAVKVASEEGLTVGVEVPAIPGAMDSLLKLAEAAEEAGAKFMIINELEMNEENSFQLRVRGFKIKPDSISAVEGSEEVAFTLLSFIEEKLSLNAHFCPAQAKDAYQYKGRLKRMALRAARPFEEVTEDGLLRRGEVTGPLPLLLRLASWLKSKAMLHEHMLHLDEAASKLESTVEALRMAKRAGVLEGLEAFIVEEYPTFDRRRCSTSPL